MLWSIPVATIAGTVVRVHVTFLLFLVWIGGSYWRLGGREAAIEGVLFILLLFLASWRTSSGISSPPAATASARPT